MEMCEVVYVKTTSYGSRLCSPRLSVVSQTVIVSDLTLSLRPRHYQYLKLILIRPPVLVVVAVVVAVVVVVVVAAIAR
jgi:hypothetical protein